MRIPNVYLTVILSLIASSVLAEVPPLINYQGVLTGVDGQPLSPSGMTTQRLEFNIYGDAEGTDHIWEPQVFQIVPAR